MILYPAAIDNNTSLPDVIDGTTNINGLVLNKYKSAIIALETELGIKPSGIHTTVRHRLDFLESITGGIAFLPGGDLGGTNSSQIVIGLQTIPIASTTPTDGYLLTYSLSANQWQPKPPPISFTAGGDLSGTNVTQSVININGASVPISGSLVTGNVLQVSGISTLTYGPINVAGGSNFITGVMPVGNLPSLLGDVAGTITSNTVAKIQNNTVTSGALVKGNIFIASSTSNWAATNFSGDISNSNATAGLITVTKINGASVSAAGSLTTGNGLYVSGSSALSYSSLNLAGGANFVSGVLPVVNLPSLLGDVTGTITSNTVIKLQNNAVKSGVLGATQDGYILTWVNANNEWEPTKIATASGTSVGIFASRPGTGSTGQTYYTTDNKGAALWDGSAWRPLGPNGSLFTIPPAANTWGWVNQNASTIVQSGDALFLSHYQDASAIGYQIATQNVPGATYTAEAWLEPLMLNFNCVGLAISDGTKITGFILQAGTSSQSLFVQHMNQFNSVAGTVFNSLNLGIPPTGFGMRIQNDGVHMLYSWSVDGGQTWRQIFSESTHIFQIETVVGVVIAPFNNGAGPGTLIPHWKLTTP